MATQYYPINLNIRNRKCLVVGGGSVGSRKANTLLECGAKVTVISPELTAVLLGLAEKKAIEWISRPYDESDIRGVFLVIAATNDYRLNHRIYLDARKFNKLCNIADQPEACDFILPSIVRREDLVITVSTSGKSPAYAGKVKQKLENCFGNENAVFLRMMGSIRKRMLSESDDAKSHKILFEKIVYSDIVELIKGGLIDQINDKLNKILGEGYDFDTLINAEDDPKA